LNILFVTKYCIKSHGGFHRIIKLAERGHNVYILGTRVEDEPFYEFSNGVNIYRCDSLFNLSQLRYPVSFPVLTIRRLTEEFDIDIIHGLGLQATNTASAGIFIRFFSSVPLILSIQGLSKTTGNPFVNIFAKSYDFTAGRMLIRTSNKIIVLAKALIGRALQLGAAKEKIIICPPSVDIERFNPDENQNMNLRAYLGLEKSFVIGFVGRLVPLKGIFDLIKASKLVVKKYPIHLLFVGDGPLSGKVATVAHSLGIPSTVTGWVSNPEAYYSVMDVFVLPSYSEGFPRTCLEAMAMKKPIIVTDVGANKELIKNGRNGFIIPPKKPKILAQKILEFIENRSLIEEWGRANRKIVEKNYTLMHEVKRLERIYEEVLGDSD